MTGERSAAVDVQRSNVVDHNVVDHRKRIDPYATYFHCLMPPLSYDSFRSNAQIGDA